MYEEKLEWILKFLNCFFRILGRRRGDTIRAYLAEHFALIYRHSLSGGDKILFFGQGLKPLYRGRSLLTKEPETIAWIDGMSSEEVIWDVGANIGVYSLYAAKVKKMKVIAFEPSASNYAVLCRNIELNKLDNEITGFCMALSDSNKFDRLYFPTTNIGASGNQQGITKNMFNEDFTPMFSQGSLGMTIDSLIENWGFIPPNHIKIDVDGIEGLIIDGADKTLKSLKTKSLLVEVVESSKLKLDNVKEKLESYGFVGKLHGKNNHIFTREFK